MEEEEEEEEEEEGGGGGSIRMPSVLVPSGKNSSLSPDEILFRKIFFCLIASIRERRINTVPT